MALPYTQWVENEREALKKTSSESITDPGDTYQTSHRDDDNSDYLFGQLNSVDNSLEMTGSNC
ncbi:MAG: hypothetical protein IKH57_08885 [Clostridia bacterium]|nr:hypothetical protein [Clostridia bacterium]